MRPGRRGSKHKVVHYQTGYGPTRKYTKLLTHSLGVSPGIGRVSWRERSRVSNCQPLPVSSPFLVKVYPLGVNSPSLGRVSPSEQLLGSQRFLETSWVGLGCCALSPLGQLRSHLTGQHKDSSCDCRAAERSQHLSSWEAGQDEAR